MLRIATNHYLYRFVDIYRPPVHLKRKQIRVYAMKTQSPDLYGDVTLTTHNFIIQRRKLNYIADSQTLSTIVD